MASLILLVLFGLGVAYFATQNTGNVHILLGSFLVSNIPLYMVVVCSLLFGIFISWLVSLVDMASIYLILHGKRTELKKSQETIEKLQEQNHVLEVKIAQATEKKREAETPPISLKPPALEHIKHDLQFSSI